MARQQSAGRSSARRYSEVEKAQAVRLVRALRAELGTDHGTVRRVADQLGFGVESVRKWVRRADVDDGAVAGVTTADRARIRVLEQENRELRRANAILKSASLDSTGQRNSVLNLAAGVSKPSRFRGRVFSLTATSSRSCWVRCFMV